MAKKNRSHSRVAELPDEVRAAVDRQIETGSTYKEIAEYINGMGTSVSLASVGRYGQKFVARMECMRLAREQARVVLENAKNDPLATVGAANQLAAQILWERLIDTEDLKDATTTEVIKSLALLERSAINRERYQMEAKRKADEAVKTIETAATAGRRNLDADTLAFIKEQIYGLTS